MENKAEFPPGYFKGKRVIELGSGTGCVGIAFAILGSEVTITDQEPLKQLMTKNVKQNNFENKINVHILDWGSDLASLNPPFDIVVMSDIITPAYSSAYPALMKTLSELTTPNTLILLSYEKRDIRDVEFFQMLKQHNFAYSKVPNNKMHPHWQSEDIGVFRITKQL